MKSVASLRYENNDVIYVSNIKETVDCSQGFEVWNTVFCLILLMWVERTMANEAQHSIASSQYKNNDVVWVNNIEETIVGTDLKF